MATTFQTGEVDGEAYRHDGGPGKWQVQLQSVPQQATRGVAYLSDDEKVPPNILFCMEAKVKIITKDWLQKRSALLAGNIQS